MALSQPLFQPFAPIRALLAACLFASLPLAGMAQTGADRSLAGAWELVSGETRQDDGTITHYDHARIRSLKLITDSHFSFTSHKGDAFYAAAGGGYSARDGIYTERVQYASYAPMRGQEFAFRYEITGDRLQLSRWRDGVRVEHEVWRRLD